MPLLGYWSLPNGKKKPTVFWTMESHKELLHVIVDKSHLIVAHQPIHSITNGMLEKESEQVAREQVW